MKKKTFSFSCWYSCWIPRKHLVLVASLIISYLCGNRNKVDDKNEKPKEVSRHWHTDTHTSAQAFNGQEVISNLVKCVKSVFAFARYWTVFAQSLKPSAFPRDCHKYRFFVRQRQYVDDGSKDVCIINEVSVVLVWLWNEECVNQWFRVFDERVLAFQYHTLWSWLFLRSQPKIWQKILMIGGRLSDF